MNRRTAIFSALLLVWGRHLTAQESVGNSLIKENSSPLVDELEKHPRCVICNMDRQKFHYARHLLHYGDDTAQGTCSVHCAAECMLRERRRGFRAIYAPDFAARSEPKPLIEAATATYLIGSDLRGVMTPVSKVSFARLADAEQARATYGGELATFAQAIQMSFEETAGHLTRRYRNDLERQARQARQKTG